MSRNKKSRSSRRLVGVAALAGLSLLTSTSANAANASATSIAASEIKADSAQFPVFGVTLNQAADLDRLTNVVVRFQSAVNFSTGDLAPDVASGGCANADDTSCDGVQMFRDNGSVDDALDAGDLPVSTGYDFLGTNCAVGCNADLALTDEVAGIEIPLSSANEGYTFLIVIRTSSSIGNGDSFSVSLQPTAFTTAPTPTLMSAVVATDPITADNNAPAVPDVTGLGLSRAAGRVHVTSPAVSTEDLASLELFSSAGDTCSSPSFVASSGPIDLRQTREDLLGSVAEAALKAFPSGQFVCYRVVDPAGNSSSFVSDGQLPAAPSAADVTLLAASNVGGAKQVTAAPDTAARTLRMYIKPGNTGDYVRARNEDALVHDEWIELTTSTSDATCSLNPPSTTACTTDIARYNNSSSSGPTLAAGDGVGYTLVNSNGNEGDAADDGVVPSAPVSGDTDVLRVSAASGKQRLIIAGGTPGASFGLFMDTTGLGTTFRPAVSPAGTLVMVTATGGDADSGTSEIRSQTPSGTQLTSGHAIGYVAIGSGGNLSSVTAEGTIPAAAAAADLTFSDALDQFRWNPAVLPANTNVRAFTGADAASAYGDGSGLGTATSTTPVAVADQDAGLNVFYVATQTVTGHESPTTADGSIPAAPSTEDAGILSTSAATGHQRAISAPDVGAPRTFRLYVDAAGGVAWVRASNSSGGTTPIEVTTSGGTATSGGTPGAQSIFANTTQLAGAHAVGFALTVGGNDSDVTADGAIPALPVATEGAVSDAANTFTYSLASPSYRVNLHFGGAADTAQLAYSQAGPDATTSSSAPVSIADPANDATVFYTATEPVSGNESRTLADGAVPAPPTTGDAGILSVSAVEDHQRLRADMDASGPRIFRLFLDPAGGTAWAPAVTTSGGAVPVQVTTSTSGATSSSTAEIFAGASGITSGWAVGYGLSNASGHSSDVATDSTIPVAPDLSTASATAAIDEVTMTGIATNRTVCVFTDAGADPAAAYAAGAKATLTTADGNEPLDTDGGWGVYYTSTANVAGHESPMVTDGGIPQPIAVGVTEASDVFNQFILPGASATDNVLIIMSSSSSPFDAYQDSGATRFTAPTSPFPAGQELDPLFVFYTVKNTGSGNESPITTAGSVPAAPAGADATMSASAAMQRIHSALDTAQRTLRLYVDPDAGGASPFVRAATASGGSTPVQITTSTSAEVVGAAGIFAGSAQLTDGNDIAYSRVLGQNESDLVADGTVPVAPIADAFTASAADQQAIVGAAAVSGTYRVFRGSSPASSKRSHTSGTPTTVSTSGLVAGDAIGYALTNVSGNESPLFADGSIPSVGAPVLQAGSDSGVSSSDRITNITTPLFDVTTVAGASVTLLEGGATRGGPETADGGGLASITTAALTEGAHTLTALSTKDGNTSPLSGGTVVTIDVTGPSAPGAPDLDAASDSGDSATDNLTNDATPLINVTGAPDGSISIKEGATVVGTATTDGSGVGQATTSALSEGAHSLVATTFDTAGNESAASPALGITIDVTAPAVPGTPDLQGASDSNVTDDDITNVTTPAFDLAGNDASVTVSLRDFGAEVGSVASGSGGSVSVSSSALSDGAHSLTGVAIDVAGNASAASPALAITVDTVAPVVPGVPDLIAASDSGSSSTDDLTNDATPSLSSAGNEAGATVAVVEGASTLGSAVAGGGGDATVTVGSLADGAHELAARASDVAGNASAASAALTVTVDTLAPAVLAAAPDLVAADDSGSSSTDDVTSVTAPRLSVAGAETASTVTLLEGAVVLGSATADSGGDATVTSAALSDGAHSVTATLTDAAGNTNAASPAFTLTIDTIAPPVPSVPDLLAASDSGSSATDDITNVTAPVVRVEGTDASVTADLIESAATLVSGTTTLAGLVDLTVPAALGEGTHNFTAMATDAAGNQSAASPPLTVTVDTTAPAAPPKPDLVASSDSGSSSTDDLTNDATPEIAVSGEAGALLSVLDGASQAGQRTGDGTVTLATLTDGSHTITATATDVAGNLGAASSALDVTIDTAAPTVTVTPPATLFGSTTATFSEDVGSLQAGDVAVRLDPGFPAATRGAVPQAGALMYDAATKTATLTTKGSFLPGEYYQVVVSASVADAAGNVMAETTKAFRGSTVEQEINLAGKHGWRIVGTSASTAFGGSYATERLHGARISMVFSGTEITWYTITGPGQGMAHVYIDGTYMGLFNNYASRTTYRVPRVFSGLSSTKLHNILVIVDGRKGSSAASDTHVAVDAFAIRYPNGARVTLVSPPLTYLWRIVTDPSASGGRYVVSDQPGAAVAFSFRGTKFAWYPVFGPANGRARVYIDGVDKGVIDLYSSSNRYNWLRFFGGLSDGVHTVRIVALGSRSGASRGNKVMTDRYAVG